MLRIAAVLSRALGCAEFESAAQAPGRVSASLDRLGDIAGSGAAAPVEAVSRR